jgi:hypothetical protein
MEALRRTESLSRAAGLIGVRPGSVRSECARVPSLGAAVYAVLDGVTGRLEQSALGVASGDLPLETVELVQTDPETGEERVAWTRRTYRRDPRLLGWLLGRRDPAQYGDQAQGPPPEQRHVIRVVLDGQPPPPRELEVERLEGDRPLHRALDRAADLEGDEGDD